MRVFTRYVVLPVFACLAMYAKASMAEMSDQLKLQRFAAACDPLQIQRLLRLKPDLNVNISPGILNPVQSAQARWIRALNTRTPDLVYEGRCRKAVHAIMTAKTYQWKEPTGRRETDLMHFVSNSASLPSDVMMHTLGYILEILKARPDFNINYTTAFSLTGGEPGTVVGSAAKSGNLSAWCILREFFPTLDLDVQPGPNTWPALFWAVKEGQLSLVEHLIGHGADWLASAGIGGDFPAWTLANSFQRAEVAKWLMDHLQGNAAPKICPSTAPN
jgi:hypothetical protein